MMSKKDEAVSTERALKLALEALEYIEHNYMSLPAPAEKAITALREALAEQPAQQEPVACQYAKDVAMPEYRCAGKCQYATPQRQPLTDEEIESINVRLAGKRDLARLFARAIEAAHGIKENT